MTSVSEPSVCAIMLTRDRPEMARLAVECFRKQTYPNKNLLVWDNGVPGVPFFPRKEMAEREYLGIDEDWSIGVLRNRANQHACSGETFAEPDILVHLDSDDWSHPNRIAEQVEFLQATSADCVGYREMLFWRQEERQAWLYSNPDPRYCLGTSLCYWRAAWERRPFEATSQGEDARFTAGLDCRGVPSFGFARKMFRLNPRMIARIHPGNTSNAYEPAKMAACPEWSRASEWDAYCAEKMT
jgi:hypothetical protein